MQKLEARPSARATIWSDWRLLLACAFAFNAVFVHVAGQSCNGGRRNGPADAGPLSVTSSASSDNCSQPATSVGRLDSGQDSCCCVDYQGIPCQGWGRRRLQQSAYTMEYPLGAPVLTGNVNVHLIWYGSWSSSDPTVALVERFVSHLGCSDYWAVVGQYYSQATAGGPKTHVSGALTLGGSAFVTGGGYSNDSCGADGFDLNHDIVTSAIAAGALGSVNYANDIFLVIPSADVALPANFPSVWCSYHYYWSDPVNPLHLGIIGNPLNSPPQCAFTSNTSAPTPNGNFEADTLVNLIVHELAEFVTDPQDNGWESSGEVQISNACAWQFGEVGTTPGGLPYNAVVGGNLWLLQNVWNQWESSPACAGGALKPFNAAQVEFQLLGVVQALRRNPTSPTLLARQLFLQQWQALQVALPAFTLG